MPATLRVVLDQLFPVIGATGDLPRAARDLARALVRTAPSGCEVRGIVPAASEDVLSAVRAQIPGLAELEKTGLARRELLAAWQLGISSGGAGGMIHSPSLVAPLVKHDRVHDNDQTVVTAWDFSPWEEPESHPRATVSLRKAMLKRAAKHADAVVVPTHSHAARVSELAKLGGRVRVIPGAAPEDFAVPSDDVGRRRALDLPTDYVLMSALVSSGIDAALAALVQAAPSAPVVVVDVLEGSEAVLAERASAAGLPESHLYLRGTLDEPDRAAVLAGADLLLAPSTLTSYPWRVVEALALGVPVVAASSGVHGEVILDGGVLVESTAEGLADGIARVHGSAAGRERLSVLSGDRGRAFTWVGAAERVWALHAEL